MKRRKNAIHVVGKIAFIVTCNGWILFDEADIPLVKPYKWCIDKSNGYVSAYDPQIKGRILMHRLIMKTPQGLYTDHINHRTTDNRRQNLRIVTSSENQLNRIGANKNSASGILGVTWREARNKWEAQLTYKGKYHYLGLFQTKEEAVMARRMKLEELTAGLLQSEVSKAA